MAPMGILGANEDGTASQADIDYFDKRSDVAGMIITGHVAISEAGWERNNQLAIYTPEHVKSMKPLTEAAKKDGNKFIAQLQHAGRAANRGKQITGTTYVPSAIEFSELDYIPHELTHEEILETIKDYGKATRNAIEAGFDGVEVHGANNYLVQEFFSSYSNRREDEWGGSLENRMKFPLAVLEEIIRVREEANRPDFIVGIRVSPEEVHKNDDRGYDIDEMLALVDKLADTNIDYIHLSLFSKYNAGSEGTDKSYAELFTSKVNGRKPVITASGVSTAADALDALNYADLISIGRATLLEPEFSKKIYNGEADKIRTELNNNLSELAIPDATIALFTMEGSPLAPLPGMDTLPDEVLHQDRESYVLGDSTKN